MMSSARFEMVPHVGYFFNSRFVMSLVNKIEKYISGCAITGYGSDLVLTERTSTQKSTHKMKNRGWVW